MTELELAREYFPGVEPRWAHHILWSCTAHPCYGIEYTRGQLEELRAKIGKPHTRGWLRKLARETRRIEAEMTAAMRDAARFSDEAQTDATTSDQIQANQE